MSKLYLYTIRDNLAEDSVPPFAAPNDAVAIRNFKNSLKDVDVQDFELQRIAEFDTSSGLIAKAYKLPFSVHVHRQAMGGLTQDFDSTHYNNEGAQFQKPEGQ